MTDRVSSIVMNLQFDDETGLNKTYSAKCANIFSVGLLRDLVGKSNSAGFVYTNLVWAVISRYFREEQDEPTSSSMRICVSDIIPSQFINVINSEKSYPQIRRTQHHRYWDRL